MSIKIVRCAPARFDQLAAFAAKHNSQPEHHIGYLGLTPEDVRATLRMTHLRLDRGFRLALAGNRLVGALGADIDKELGRAWLYGPIVAEGEWATTADALYAALWPSLPAAIVEHEMFVDARNAHARDFAARHSFEQLGEWAIYFITPDRLAPLPAAEAGEWDDRYRDQLEALHNRLFPNSNYTMSYITGGQDGNTTLLIAAEGDALLGYFFGRYEPESGEGYVDLVGVDESRRRAGLGRRLVLAGLDRLRRAPGLRQVNLTVAAGNVAAMALYDALGFARERDMVAFRKRVNRDGHVGRVRQ